MCIDNKIKQNLTPDLLKPGYSTGQYCYVASEAYWHLTGKIYTPGYIKIGDLTHWILRDGTQYIDLTADQFDTPPDYAYFRGCGFLTKNPSKRTQILIDRVLLLVEI